MIKQWTGIILAAGKGKRMGGLKKVMQPLASLPMLGHVINNLVAAKPAKIILVLAPNDEGAAAFARTLNPKIEIVIQTQAKGTAAAVKLALPKVKTPRVLVAYGDTPLVQSDTYRKLARNKSALTLAGFEGNKKGYGRILMEKNKIVGIQEDDQEGGGKKSLGSGLLNAGLMAFDVKTYKPHIARLKNNNPKKEFYLTDLAAIGSNKALVLCKEAELLGANTLEELATLEKVYQEKKRQEMLRKGVYMAAPETVFFAWDTTIGKGTRLAPNIVFGAGVKIAPNVEIKSFCHIEGAQIGAQAVIGPYARLRPETELGKGVHIGNFVEVKKSQLGAGVKANHLTYLGDSDIGADANIGAGTITCNYDGRNKHKTIIGAGAFIGSNSALVAPIKISKGAYIGSGSVITKDVPAKTLVVARAQQKTIRKLK